MPSKPHSIVIEFLGCTGSGKSSLISQLIKKSKAHQLDLRLIPNNSIHNKSAFFFFKLFDEIRLFPQIISITLFQRTLVSKAIQSILRTSNKLTTKLNILRNFLKTLARFKILKKNKNKNSIYIFDEGPLHSLHGLFVYPSNQPQLDKVQCIASLLPRADLTIIIDASDELIIKNSLSRPDPPWKGFSQKEWLSVSINARKVFSVLKEDLDSKNKIMKLRLSENNQQKLDKQAALLLAYIENTFINKS